MVWKATVAVIAFCATTAVNAQTFRDQVESEKQAIAGDVDKGIIATIRANPQIGYSDVMIGELRRQGFWLAMAPGLGTCHANGGDAAYVVWLSAADSFRYQSLDIRPKGMSLFVQNKQENALAGASPAQRAAFCKVYITAYREILAERFGVQ